MCMPSAQRHPPPHHSHAPHSARRSSGGGPGGAALERPTTIPAGVFFEHSTAEGEGLFHATEGELASIIVTAHDAEGNRERGLDPAGNRFNLSATVPCVTSTWKPVCAEANDVFRMVAWRALGERLRKDIYEALRAPAHKSNRESGAPSSLRRVDGAEVMIQQWRRRVATI